MRIPWNKNNSSVAERQKLQGRGEDSEYRAEEAENGDQQSSFLNISSVTIQWQIRTVNAYREPGSLSSNVSMNWSLPEF
jgi:hypothetical protein